MGKPITGLTLHYQSTNPLDISVGGAGAVVPSFPGAASVYAICQPSTCNPAPINQIGLFGTGLSISSNAVNITTPALPVHTFGFRRLGNPSTSSRYELAQEFSWIDRAPALRSQLDGDGSAR